MTALNMPIFPNIPTSIPTIAKSALQSLGGWRQLLALHPTGILKHYSLISTQREAE